MKVLQFIMEKIIKWRAATGSEFTAKIDPNKKYIVIDGCSNAILQLELKHTLFSMPQPKHKERKFS